MDAVKQEMESQEHRLVGQPLVDMEQEAMERVFEYGPNEVAEEETKKRLYEAFVSYEG